MWSDGNGFHIGRDQPSLGIKYTRVEMPDPIRWSYPPNIPDEIKTDIALPVETIFDLVSQSVYLVSSMNSTGLLKSEKVSFGSAVAITEELALTNCHVVAMAGNGSSIEIVDQGKSDQAELVAANYESDRCVIRVRNMRLHPVEGIRQADSIKIGEAVYAMGNPNLFERTFSEGLISGKRDFGQNRMIQNTAPISPGSSGGGLFDARGNLIGITTSTLKGSQAINFAIPAEDYWK